MAAGDLTTLSEVRTFMHISSSDTSANTFLSSAITNITAAIQRECQRTFIAADYVEFHNTSQAQPRIQPNNKPIIKVNSVRWGYCQAISVQYSGSAVSATAGITTARMLTLRTIDSGGITDTNIDLTNVAYTLWSQAVTAINAVSGWSAALLGGTDGPTRWLQNNVNLTCKSAGSSFIQYFCWPNIDIFAYTVDTTYNTIAFQPLGSYQDFFFEPDYSPIPIAFPSMYQGVLIDYRGGYETIPADLNLLCQQMVADLYDKSNLDMNLQSDKLGDAQQTLIDPMLRRAVFSDVLAPYKRIGMAGGNSQ